MRINRRNLLKKGAAGTALLAMPNVIPSALHAATWIKKNDTIKVGILFSTTGGLAVIENDSTQVTLYAIDEINAAGGVAGMQIEPVVVDAKSDIKVYSEKISQLILRDRVVATFGGYTSASRRAVAPIIMKRDHLFYYPLVMKEESVRKI